MRMTKGEFIKRLPAPYNEQAIVELGLMGVRLNEEIYVSDLGGGVSSLFVWSKTTQGHSYWADLSSRLAGKPVDEPLPETKGEGISYPYMDVVIFVGRRSGKAIKW